MSDTAPSPSKLALRLARLVARVVHEPTAVAEHRSDVRALAKALKKAKAELAPGPDATLLDGGVAVVTDDDAARDAVALLATRLEAYGVERLVLSDAAAEADLFDLVKLLATPPTQPDPLAFFAARAAAVDARAIPRTLRAAEVVEAPSVEEPVSVKEPASVKERASARVTRPSGSQAVVVEAPSQETPDKRSDRLTESLPIPETDDAELAALFATLQQTDPVEHLRDPLERLVTRADLAFRAGDSATMLVAMAGLVAIEHLHLERDASDERRREFARAVRKLATPPILRQLATLRHKRADDAATIQRVQAILHRYGTDGAEALIDEWANAPSAAARAICVEALRALRRTHDALFDLVRHTDDQRVRQGIALLGALGDARAEQLVLEQLRHPDARTRREVMATLERFPSVAALDAIGVGLLDDEPTVRLRAIAAVTPRGALAVKLLAPLLDTEPDREVLYAAIAALGSVGGAEAVQVLIRAVNGETQHAKRRSAAYRLQACAALAQIRTPQAMAAVQSLRDDRDRELREGAMRLVAQAARRGTTAQRALTDA
ncbi:MAG TPA: HEAT repeat domain-containing protein [Gemmatimonadaceae bacterium]|nr:HEAT repeat domain-containing protein [Gemmatimonadaceae bacterium]